MTVGELRDFWQRYYVPSNATLVVAGGVKADDVQQLAKKYFGWMPKVPTPIHRDDPFTFDPMPGISTTTSKATPWTPSLPMRSDAAPMKAPYRSA